MPIANRVYRGPNEREPETLSKTVTGALLPATFVTVGSTAFAQATSGTGRLAILGNRDMYDQDLDTAYTSGNMGIAYRLRPDDEFQAAMAAATYTFGQELTVSAAGRLAAAASGNVVVAFFDDKTQAGVALAAGTRADIVIANSYMKA